MGWVPPRGNAVNLELSSSIPPWSSPHPVDLSLIRVGEAVHQGYYVVHVAINHVGRITMMDGESLVATGHMGRIAMLSGEVLLMQRHVCVHEIRIQTIATHMGRMELLVGGYKVATNHIGVHSIAFVTGHSGRHAMLDSESLIAVNYKSLHSIMVAANHVGIYPVLQRISHAGNYQLMVGERYISTNHLCRYASLIGETLVSSNHAGLHGIILLANRCISFSVLYRITGRHQVLFDISTPIIAEHKSIHAILDEDAVITNHLVNYSIIISASHQCVWQYLPVVSTSHQGVWHMLISADKGHIGHYAILPYDPASSSHYGSFTVHSGEFVIITDQPSLTYKGRVISLVSAEIRMDDGSYAWLAKLRLANAAEWICIMVGDPVSINLYGEVFNLVVDEKESQRSNAGAVVTLTLLAVSPLAMRRDRVTKSWIGPVSARTAVEDLLGVVEWKLPDWVIPAGKLAADRADPVTLARQIVGAVGGVIESNPDGSINCRSRFPQPVPSWTTIEPNHLISNDIVISESEIFQYVEIINRISVANSESRAMEDVEYIPDEDDRRRGIIRVHPSPWRQVSLAHTGDDQVQLLFLGEQERVENELLQIHVGQGTTRYPVFAIVTSSWQYNDLGSPSFVPDSREIATEALGYSLLKLSYRTRYLVWSVADMRDTEILFLISDS